ncbi:MAG: hypothetical protein FJ190_12670 [Gammaproteobacteria bacterium]|nr:hypothetical protein [Gammaproteobacteria bacterium]
MQQEVLIGLKKIPFLANISTENLTSLAEKAKQTKYTKQSTVIMEGDETSSLFIRAPRFTLKISRCFDQRHIGILIPMHQGKKLPTFQWFLS